MTNEDFIKARDEAMLKYVDHPKDHFLKEPTIVYAFESGADFAREYTLKETQQAAQGVVEAMTVANKMLEVVNLDGAEEVAKLMTCKNMFRHALSNYKKAMGESDE